MIVRADVQRNKTQNASWRKRQQTVLIAPRKFQGVSLFESNSGVERKNVDTALVDLTLPVTNAFTGGQLLNGVAQGAANQTRVGRRMLMKSLQYRFHLGTAAGASTTQLAPVRVLVVYDRQANGAVCLNTDVLATAVFQGFQNLGNTDRFLILSDMVHGLDGNSTQPTSGKVYKKLNLDTMFIGNGNLVADIGSGSVYAFIATPGSATALVVNLNFRIRYVDL